MNLIGQEKSRERQVREELERELREKDAQMQELLLRHQEVSHVTSQPQDLSLVF